MPGSPMLVLIVALVITLGQAAIADPDQRAVPRHFRDCVDCPEMVTIPVGSFMMGSAAAETARDLEAVAPYEKPVTVKQYLAQEHPQHSVSIERSFALGKYPVTRGEFAAFVSETGYSTNGGCTLWSNHEYLPKLDAGWQNPGFTQTDRDPVVCVNWQDAKAYTAWLNGKLSHASLENDRVYRLPTEAEWEYAARAGTRTARWWGDLIGVDNANCDGCGSRWDKKQTAPSGSFQINPFGLSDVLGNVWEWTEDCWNENYEGAPQDGSAWESGACDIRVMRGGSWTNHPWVLRSADRTKDTAGKRTNYRGFRVAKMLRESLP